ncbi:MAG: ABC transporter ATP-binding protein [Pseudomonadota bacterium]|nr:ABC transporter ATP-binding protein [Pseudomonadota bacterium]
MLKVYNLSKSFGSLRVTQGVSFHLNKGARHALIGPNGAGKTTLFNILSGELPADSGRITFEGTDITAYNRWRRVRAGISRSFQGNNLFLEASVLDNIIFALLADRGPATNFLKLLASEKALRQKAVAVAADVGLEDRLGEKVGDLAYGFQRQLEVALVLALSPKVMLLDEPTAGMSLAEKKEMLSIIERLSKNLSILIIEHDMDVVFHVSNWMTVLDEGKIFFEGTPDDVRRSDEVRSRYLSEA